MVEAAEARVTGCGTENGILRLEISEPQGPTFQFWPSTRTEVTCPHLQEDPFEKKVIVAAKSSTEGSGRILCHTILELLPDFLSIFINAA